VTVIKAVQAVAEPFRLGRSVPLCRCAAVPLWRVVAQFLYRWSGAGHGGSLSGVKSAWNMPEVTKLKLM
jgi:hypothetical protein